ncbi:F-box protein PP2-A13 [Linum grandiflorum]
MGAAFSDFLYGDGASTTASAAAAAGGTSLGDVPESCAAEILMYLDPPEICALARLNRSFRGASSADFVWKTKLPSNYGFLVEKVLGVEKSESLCRKEIYSRLCAPNIFGDGNKMIWLEKNSGKNCVTVSYKAMRITGIDDRRYWTHIPADESRFKQIAYLQQTWWLEVVGELDDFQFPVGKYSLFFKLQLGKPTSAKPGRCGTVRSDNNYKVHGWDRKPVRFHLSTSNGQTASSERYLKERHGWEHVLVGEFTVENPNVATKIKFSMMQIDCTHTKGGLCLDSVLVCPTEVRDRVVKQF